jgi:hypothetical protein
LIHICKIRAAFSEIQKTSARKGGRRFSSFGNDKRLSIWFAASEKLPAFVVLLPGALLNKQFFGWYRVEGEDNNLNVSFG